MGDREGTKTSTAAPYNMRGPIVPASFPRHGKRRAHDWASHVIWSGHVHKLGRLAKQGKTRSVSIPIKKNQIVDHLFGPALRDKVMKIMPLQKQTTAGQRTRLKCYIAAGDDNGHIGLGAKAAKEVLTGIRGGIINPQLDPCPSWFRYCGLSWRVGGEASRLQA
eukprot:gene3275-3589_t